jgi:hypothetical protein
VKLEILHDDCLPVLQAKINAFFIKKNIKKTDIIEAELKDVSTNDLSSDRYIYTILYEKKEKNN